MKTTNILITIFAIAIFLLGYMIGERSVNEKIPKGYELITAGTMDSIRSLKPEIQVVDSIVYVDTIVYRDRLIPAPIHIDEEINLYVDSLINDTTHLIISDWIKGSLIKRNIELRRSVVLREIKIPYPVFYPQPIFKDKPKTTQLYIGAGLGSLVGADIGVITRNNWGYGAEVLTDFDKRYYLFKLKRVIDF